MGGLDFTHKEDYFINVIVSRGWRYLSHGKPRIVYDMQSRKVTKHLGVQRRKVTCISDFPCDKIAGLSDLEGQIER